MVEAKHRKLCCTSWCISRSYGKQLEYVEAASLLQVLARLAILLPGRCGQTIQKGRSNERMARRGCEQGGEAFGSEGMGVSIIFKPIALLYGV